MTPDPAPVADLIEAFRRSKAMFTAVSLSIFDRTPATVADLARELNANADALERLLDSCLALGFLSREGGVYSNTEVSQVYLRRSSPQTLAGYILYSDKVLWSLWANLEDAIREGTHRWRQTYGEQGSIFAHFFRTTESRREFLQGMHGHGLLSSPRVVEAFDLSRFHRLVDLGGATGHLAAAAVTKYPNLSAAVFDLPSVVDTVREFVDFRVELIAGDFFADPLPPADLYALGRILHDWSEAKIRALLQKISAALPEGGGLLIAEKLLAPDKAGPLAAHMQSLNMLVCTEGKERTVAEYEVLLREAGFESAGHCFTDAPVDGLLAIKVSAASGLSEASTPRDAWPLRTTG